MHGIGAFTCHCPYLEMVNVIPCSVRRHPQPTLAVPPSEGAWSAARARGFTLSRAVSPSERARRKALTAAIQVELALPLITPKSDRPALSHSPVAKRA